jgi:hypothetical protein
MKTYKNAIPKLSNDNNPFTGFFIILPQIKLSEHVPSQNGSSASKPLIYIIPNSSKHLYYAYPLNNYNPAIANIVYVNPNTIIAFPNSANDANNVIIILLRVLTDDIVLNGLSTRSERNALNYKPELEMKYGI